MLLLKVVALMPLATVILFMTKLTEACNEAVCASIVSKCMLQQSCDCTTLNYTCYKECASCLSYLYDECCSCLDFCPKFHISGNQLGKKSHVEDFDEPVPSLFKALTAGPDLSQRWVSYTFPVDFNALLSSHMQNKVRYYSHANVDKLQYSMKTNSMTVNCTVAYMAHCTSWNKCKASCQSMGATSYRWFHDGCCECIGNTCINYGINESRCAHCPLHKDADPLLDEYDDYGQDEEFLEHKYD